MNSSAQSVAATAFRYMTRFRCLGADCEDNCCHSWDVPVDRADHDKLQRSMAGNEESQRLFQIGLKRNSPEIQTQHDYARLQHNADGSCRFLAQYGGCQIHAEFGEAALPRICSIYPRASSNVLGRPELSGFLSCPEVARLSLLAGDAMDLVPFDPESLPRQQVVQASASGPYFERLTEIRTTMMGFLALQQYPIATRLFIVSYLADRLTPFFHKDSKSFSEQRLADEISRTRGAVCGG